ncbi:radical SAM protein [Candidatus Pelagibacter sp. Uisw_136]|jgi:sulfatase maturation enzyme AslB (radical SAM superfamily)|uniref:radical SAM protein n=1 Tax=Candidatus Pelagibacter sp. Uisw_136 TaxID=3230991 RepID=UPI0039E88E65
MKIDTEKKNIWIWGVGAAGKWATDNITSNIKGFIDSGAAKQNIKYNNLSVYTPEKAQELINPDDLILVTVLDIQDVIPVIENKFKGIKWSALGDFMSNEKVNLNLTGESDEFIEYTLKAVELCHKSFLNKDNKFLHSVDIVISEKCTLNCKDCANLMQYYQDAKNINYEMIVRDFENLTSKIDHVFEVRLIGGEPFFNKDIYRIIDYFLETTKITKLVIYTNATIPLKAELMKKYVTPKLVFSITDYGTLSKNTEKVTGLLEEMNIAYRALPPNNWTDSAVIKDQKRSEEGMIDIFERCCGKNLFTVMYGKLYRCPFVSNAERLHAIPFDEKNGVSLEASKEDIIKYTSGIKYLPACNFCNGRSHDAPEIIPAIQAKGKIPFKKYY